MHCRWLQAELLRGAPLCDHPLLHDADFWLQARREGVMALLWHRLHRQVALPEARVEEIAEALREQAVERAALVRAAGRLLTMLHEAEIAVVPLRGLTLAERLYPRTDLRPQSDIDLLVRPQAMEAALELLRGQGFAPINDWQPHLLARGTVLVDLHDEPLGADRIRCWRRLTPLSVETFFDRARPGRVAGAPALVIDDALQLPWLCFHAAKHSFERMIWLWDIALLCRRITNDDGWGQAEETIRFLGLQRPCWFALGYAAANLAAPVPPELLRAIRPAMDWRERALFQRHLRHEQIPFLAERLFARMLPGRADRLAFWRETIVPRREVREQIAAGGCVRCTFIRTRLSQLMQALSLFGAELRGWRKLGG